MGGRKIRAHVCDHVCRRGGDCGKEKGREMVGTRELCVSVSPNGTENLDEGEKNFLERSVGTPRPERPVVISQVWVLEGDGLTHSLSND